MIFIIEYKLIFKFFDGNTNTHRIYFTHRIVEKHENNRPPQKQGPLWVYSTRRVCVVSLLHSSNTSNATHRINNVVGLATITSTSPTYKLRVMTMRFLVLALAAISSPMMVKATAATAAAAAAAATKTHSGKRNGSLNANNNNNNNNKPINIPNNNADLSAALLEKAVRLSSNLGLHDVQLDLHVPELQLGVPLQLEPEFMNVNTDSNQRFLEDGGDEGDNNEDEGASGDENDDDYYMNQLYSFSGFSLKYAKCQTIQRFSEDAIKNGEYSAMVKDDIVILRLCPTSQCNSNKQYGCHYNYAEYAIGVSDYVKIMLKYTIDKRSKMCDFCATCSGGRKRDRKLEEEGDNEENEEDGQSEQGDEDQQFDDDNYYKVDDDGAGDNNAANGDDNAAAAANDDYVDPCDTYADDCDAAYNYCNGGADDDVGYLDYVDYLDYLDCVKVQGQEGQDSYYWIRPRCDATKGTIHMDIYYDPYCSQYAGGDVNLREFSGIYFRTSVFEPFYSGTCVDCSENVSFVDLGCGCG
jgi:hypothetical protein